MRLILSYSVGDGCTYSCDIRLPFEYSSKEQAELDLLALMESKMQPKTWVSNDIVFAGHILDASDFWYHSEKQGRLVYNEPRILTVDEWFGDQGNP